MGVQGVVKKVYRPLISMGGPSPCPEEFTTPHPTGKTRPRAATNKPGAELWVWSDNPAKGQGKKARTAEQGPNSIQGPRAKQL